MKIHKLRACIGILCIVFMLTNFLFPVFGTNLEESPQELIQLPTGYKAHNPIRINNNSGFNLTNGVSAGNGTPGIPYILEGWEINGGGNGSCIYIGNTTAYFIVRDCLLYNATGNFQQYHWDTALSLYNVDNGKLFNNTCINNARSGIQVGDSSNNVIENNTCYSNNVYQVQVGFSNNNVFRNNTIISNGLDSYGFYLAYTSNNKFYDNNLTNCGFYFYSSSSAHIATHIIPSNNTVNNKPVYYRKNIDMAYVSAPNGLGQIILGNVQNLKIENLNISGGGPSVISGYSSDIYIVNNTFSNNNNVGILLWSSNNHHIINNTCMNNSNGIWAFQSSTHNIISDNHCNNNSNNGIYLSSNSNQNNITNNICQNNNIGIYIAVNSQLNNIYYNNCSQNNDGIQLYSSSIQNNISNNSVSQNTGYGIRLSLNCHNNSLSYNNFIDNNKIGISINNGNDNLIHHNNFINNNVGGIQGSDSGINNYWNDTNFRGNYWDDYESIYVPPATSNGYIWDIPYNNLGSANSNDSYPLVYPVEFDPPMITDMSSMTGGTGQSFIIKCNITDNSNVSVAYVFYWFGSDIANAINVSLTYNIISGYWEYQIPTLPENKLDQLKYNISAVDPNSNWGSKQNIVVVEDIIPPTAVAGPNVAILQGERTILNASLSSDNIGITSYTWHLMNNGNDLYYYRAVQNLAFNSGANWFVELLVEDAAGNNDTDHLWVNVSDVTKPQIYDPILPEYVNITEQIDIWISAQDPMVFDGIDTMKLNYTDINGTTHNVTMTQAFYTQWLYQIPGFPTPGTIKLFFWANDTSGNWNVTEVYTIDVLDNILPEILDLKYPAISEIDNEIEIESEVDDNIGIFAVRLNYTDSNGIAHNISMIGTRGEIYKYTIPGQTKTGMVKFRIWVVDLGNNSIKSKIYEIQIIKKHLTVKLPEINWISIPSKVNINEPIEIMVNVYDDLGIDFVLINYSNVFDIMKNVTMNDLGNGNYSYTITNQTSAGYVDVYVTAKNSQDVWNRTKLYVIEVIEMIDNTKPKILSTTPKQKSINVKTNVIISIIFSESMNASSVASGLFITPTINFELTWFDNNVLLKLAFLENLSFQTQYNITISLAAKDLAGNRLEEIYLLSFTTEKAPIPEKDKDKDGMDDSWELKMGLDPNNPNDANYDNDSDNLTNLEEFIIGTDPFNSDTDGDNMPDGWENNYYPDLDPLSPDANIDVDGDSFNNFEEFEAGTSPTDDESKPTTKEKDKAKDDYSVVMAIIILLIIILILFLILIKRMRKPKDEKEGETEEESEESAEDEEIECTECGATVSASETECPECGSELNVKEEIEPDDEELTEEELDDEEAAEKVLDEEEPSEDGPIEKEPMDKESEDSESDEE